jgi:hypothetical protein
VLKEKKDEVTHETFIAIKLIEGFYIKIEYERR